MAVVPKQNGLNILRKLVPLNTLTEATLAELMEAVEFEKIAKGDYLFHEGDTNPERIYLLSGKVALLEDGKEVDTVAADSNMARYPIAHHLPRRFSVQARTKAEIVRIDGHQLSELLTRGGNALYRVEELSADADEDWMGQLLQSPIFQRIPAANIQNIMMRMEEVQVAAGEMVIRQGDDGDYFYLINRGQCSITRERRDGEIEELAQVGAGHCLGEESLLSGKPRGSTVSMLTDGILFRLGKKDFIEYIKLPLANAISYEVALGKVEKGAVWLDVRSPPEHQRVHIPNSRSVPFNTLRSVLPELDKQKPYVIYCQDGLVSSTAVYLLMEQGLDAYVLQRGLESVPDEALHQDKSQERAQVINLRPEQAGPQEGMPDSGSAPDDEAGLLRERLQKTEAQAQEQLQRAHKMKLMLEQLKGRLAEAEAAETREGEASRQLAGEVEKLQKQLNAGEKSRETLKKRQTSIEAQLAHVAGERDRLQDELGEVHQQIGKLEKRLEVKQQEEARLQQSQAEAQEALQRALSDSRTELDEVRAEKTLLAQEAGRLQEALEGARAELAQLGDELRQSRQAAEAALAKQQEEARLRESQAEAQEALQRALSDSRTELGEIQAEKTVLAQEAGRLQEALEGAQAELAQLGDELRQSRQAAETALEQQQATQRDLQALQEEAAALRTVQERQQSEAAEQAQAMAEILAAANGRIDSLEAALTERGADDAARSAALESTDQQQRLLHAELDRLRSELETAGARISHLDAERQALERAQTARQSDQEAALRQSLVAAVEGRDQALSALQAASDERDRVAAELAVLKSSFAQLQQLADEQESGLAELRLQMEHERRAGTEDEQARDRQQAELERLTQALAAANAELESACQAAQEKTQSLTELQQLRDTDQAVVQKTTARLEAAEQALQELHQEREQLTAELSALDTERSNLTRQLESDRQRLTGLETRLAEAAQAEERPSTEEVDSLRAELAEATAARVAAEDALAAAGRVAADTPAAQGEIKAVQAELETLNDALDEADKAYEALAREKAQLQEELERLRAAAPGAEDNARLQEQQAAAEQEAARLSKALEALREQVEAEAHQRRQAEETAAEQPVDSPATETSAERVAELQQALEGAQSALKELELNSSADAAECEVLRQDIDKLKRSLEERSAELERTRKESLLLEEKTEERNSEIDRLRLALEAAQVEADEANFNKDEALEARKQVEDSLYALQKQIEHGRPRDDLLDKRLAASRDGLVVGHGSSRQKLVGVLIGAVLAFGVAEGLSLLGGNGEIISGFLEEAPAVSPSPVNEPVAAAVPPVAAPLAKPPAEPAPALPEKPRAPVVAAREPVTPKPPPAPREPATGTLIQDRLAAGGSGPEMVYVAGGVLRMGSAISQLVSEEQPVHDVRLRSFSIGRYEVTFREYARFAAATGRGLPDDLGWGQGPRPVINVSWNDARAYTDWLSEQTGQRYRLPSEAEWEYAAAAGTDTPYWWGFDLGSGNANCFNCGSEWDGATTAPVGRFAANPFGLHNTAGNVMEWVEDCYHGSYEGAPTDGSSWQEPGCRERVVRGGAFNKPGVSLRVTRRGRHQVDTRLLVVGFRVVREVR
jgi:formylglycine-generating enzyme required for sulfatase activity/CRP-like cAMP-binding protein/chromosome segregation ATPase